ELDITVGDTSEFCTDIAAEPKQTPPPTPGSALQPTLIIEVARTESLNSLNSLTVDYFSANAQTNLTQVPNPALNGPNPPPNTSPMITLANTTPNLAISFGTAPLNKKSIAFVNNTGISAGRLTGFLQSTDIACTAAGMPNYQITIPANLLFMPGVVPAGVPNNFTIDLWEVQQQALYRLVCIAFTQIGNFKQ
ncbi:291_t:CDS:2, partial [Racocetra fulgida]